MEKFTRVTGPAAPLLQANIDTDVIIRIERLTGGGELGRYALEALRMLPDGTPNPGCALNEARFHGAPILLAGRNFGCGSSREGAVTALMALGLRCVAAPSFGDIFHGNAVKNGLLPVILPEAQIEALAALSRAGDFTVDLERCLIVPPEGAPIPFVLDELQRRALLDGLDEIGLTLTWIAEIAAWQRADRLRRPWVWNAAAGDRR